MGSQRSNSPQRPKARHQVGRLHCTVQTSLRDFARYLWHNVVPENLQHEFRQWRLARKHRIYARFVEVYLSDGAPTAVQAVREELSAQRDRSGALVVLTRKAMDVNVRDAALFIDAVAESDLRPDFMLWCVLAYWDSGLINQPYALLDQVKGLSGQPEPVLEKVRQLMGAWRLFHALPTIPVAREQAAYLPETGKLLYVASSSRPYHITGYTSRTHHLLEALKAQRYDVHCVTRPGYPFDRPDSRNVTDSEVHKIEGVLYERLPGKHRREVDYDLYLSQASETIEQAARRIKPAIIQAASNYEAGLPALIAARKLGIPFVYEVRGLWEYTAASKKPGWESTERFALDERMEGLVAAEADHVFTLTNAMAKELVRRGAAASRISLAPNAIEPESFKRPSKNTTLLSQLKLGSPSFVVGYVGSVVGYEGLDDLLEAFAIMLDEIPDAALVIVGDGDARYRLESRAGELGIKNRVVFTGKVPPAGVKDYFSIIDAIAIPRKPFQVCKLVSPLKPLEAMAMKIPMVVSDVPALAEMVEHERTALVHESGNPDSLAENLLRLAKDSGFGEALADAAYLHVTKERTWSTVTEDMALHYPAPLQSVINQACKS